MNKKLITLSLCHSLPAAKKDGSKPLWLPLIPLGKFSGRDGRCWNNADADAVITNTQLPFILDVDHNSEISPDTSASGWFTELKIEDNHIVGKLELNQKGRAAIDDKRYKYYSPAFSTDRNGRVHAFVSVALTNKPNLNVPALNSAGAPDNFNNLTKEELFMLAALLAALGLAADADQQTALNTIQNLKNQKPDLNAFVPKATHEQVVTELNAANQKLADIAKASHDKAVEVAINAAIAEKKIAPADKDFYISACATEKGLEDFRQFISNKAPIIGEANIGNKPPEGGETALNSEQKQILAQLGVTVKGE